MHDPGFFSAMFFKTLPFLQCQDQQGIGIPQYPLRLRRGWQLSGLYLLDQFQQCVRGMLIALLSRRKKTLRKPTFPIGRDQCHLL